MDSGYVPPGDTFEPDFDPCSELDAAEVIWIIDQLLCLEITWHQGYPLSQTVYTSLHVDRLMSPVNMRPYTFFFGQDTDDLYSPKELLVHEVLRAYCIAMIKSCELTLDTIKSQTYYEEEDFVTHQYGRDLLPRTNAKEARNLLEEADALLPKLGLTENMRRAFAVRLRFRRLYLSALEGDSDHWSVELPQSLEQTNETHNLGKSVTSAFSNKTQRQLATSTPPRPIVTMAWEEAFQKWSQLFSDVAAVNHLKNNTWIISSPHSLQRATWSFAYRNPPPGAFARAKLQSDLFAEPAVAGAVSHYDLLLTDIRDLVLAGHPLTDLANYDIEFPSDPRHVGSRLMEEFMDKALSEYLNLYRMVCQNRCRMRRLFAQSIPILDNLEDEAKMIDARLADVHRRFANDEFQPLASWTAFHKISIVAWTVQLGFETDIYLPDEIGPMYRFLVGISRGLKGVLEDVDAATSKRCDTLKSRVEEYAIGECMQVEGFTTSLRRKCEANIAMASALWRLYTILTWCDIIKTPKRDFAQLQMLYDLRMKPYLCISNDSLPSLSDFEQAKQLDGTLDNAFAEIDSDVKQAKAALAEMKQMTPEQAKHVGSEAMWKQEIKRTETTCVAIAVTTAQLARIAGKHANLLETTRLDLAKVVQCSIPPPGPKRYHDWWVVPQLKEIIT